MMTNELVNRIALVTGASRGIGQRIAIGLAASGVDVAVNYHSRRADALRTCDEIEKLGQRAIAVAGDVSVAADVARVIQTIEDQLGTVTILVNNADRKSVV